MPVVLSIHELGKGGNMVRLRFATAAAGAMLIASLAATSALTAASVDRPERRGEIRFEPDAKEQTAVPKPFQLEAHTFEFRQQPQPSISDDVNLSLVTFPSPVKTKYESNNTVHCE